MRILFAADLHGRTSLYRAMFTLARRARAGAVLLGGDLLPHARSPWGQVQYVQGEFRSLLASFQDEAAVPVFAVLGNHDWAAARPALAVLERQGLLRLIDGAVADLGDGWQVVGYSCVPVTPFPLKDHERRDLPDDALPEGRAWVSEADRAVEVGARRWLRELPSIAEELEALPRPRDPAQAVYVVHGPPHATALDRTGDGLSVGSQALRAFLTREQPAPALFGHIHEAPWVSGRYWDHVGRTLCLNPGQGEPLHAVLLDTEDPEGSLQHTLLQRR